jgi:RNA polymerase sigma-70 factor, ECF subfamily
VTEAELTAEVEAHYAPLYRFALGLTGGSSAAADLTQEAIYRWLRDPGAVRDRARLRSWLFTTLYREHLRHARRTLRFPEQELETVAHELPAVAPGEIAALDAATIVAALQTVPEDYRAPLSLFYFEGLPYARIAEVLDIPPGTVMSRLARGREHLRRRLRDAAEAADRKVIPFRPAGTG